MRVIAEPQREIPAVREVDVMVARAGMDDIAVAMAAEGGVMARTLAGK